MLELPEILDFPDKLLPLITEINNHDYFLLEGGRGGGKSQKSSLPARRSMRQAIAWDVVMSASPSSVCGHSRGWPCI